MRDKTLDIFLIVLFGLGGIAILILAWVQPMQVSERIFTTIVGSIGPFWVLIRAPLLRSISANMGDAKASDEVEVKNEG